MLREYVDPVEWKHQAYGFRAGRSAVIPLTVVGVAICFSVLGLALALRPDSPAASVAESNTALAEPIIILPRGSDNDGSADEATVTSAISLAGEKSQGQKRLSSDATSNADAARETVVQKTNTVVDAPLLAEQSAELEAEATNTMDGAKTSVPTVSGNVQRKLLPDKDRGPSGPVSADFRKSLPEDGIDAVALRGENLMPKPTPRRTSQRVKSKSAADRSMKVSNDVRLRARPDNAAKAITVIRGGERVKVIECDEWCEVLYAGKRGFVFKSFLKNAS